MRSYFALSMIDVARRNGTLSKFDGLCLGLLSVKFRLVLLQCTTQWFDILQHLAAHDNPQIQHRAIFILFNMMAADKELAERLVNSSMLEVLMAVSKLNDPERKAASDLAEQALRKAEEWSLVKHVDNSR